MLEGFSFAELASLGWRD